MMKNWHVFIIILILTVFIVLNGFFMFKVSTVLDNVKTLILSGEKKLQTIETLALNFKRLKIDSTASNFELKTEAAIDSFDLFFDAVIFDVFGVK